MAVLSAAILNKSGKILLARQFVEIARIRIEGILAAFPKLVLDEDNSVSKQHTYVETGNIRYLYQPVENIFVLLVTTRGSNIVRDLETLRLFSKIVPEVWLFNEIDFDLLTGIFSTFLWLMKRILH